MERAEFIEKLGALYEPAELRSKLGRFKEVNGGGMVFYELDDEQFERVVTELPILIASAGPFLPVAGSDPLRAKQLAYLVIPGDDKAGRVFKSLQDELADIKANVARNDASTMNERTIPVFEKKLAFVQRTARFLETVAAAGELPYPANLEAAGFTPDNLVDLQVLLSGEAPAAPPVADKPAEPDAATLEAEIQSPITQEEFNRRANHLLGQHDAFWSALRRGPLFSVLAVAEDDAFDALLSIDLPTMILAARAFKDVKNSDYKGRTLTPTLANPAVFETELANGLQEAAVSVLQTYERVLKTALGYSRSKDGKMVGRVAIRMKSLLDQFSGHTDFIVPGTVTAIGGEEAVFAAAAELVNDTYMEDQEKLRGQLDALHEDIYRIEVEHGNVAREIIGMGTSISVGNIEGIQAFADELQALLNSGVIERWRDIKLKPEQRVDFFNGVLTLGEKLEENLNGTFGTDFERVMEGSGEDLLSDKILNRSRGIGQLYALLRMLNTIRAAFPDHGKAKIASFEKQIQKLLKPALAKVITDKVHEANLNRVRFSQSLPKADGTEPAFVTTLDLSKPVYMHIYADIPLVGIAELGHPSLEWNSTEIAFGAVEKQAAAAGYMCIGDAGYLCTSILPEDRHAELSRSIGNYREFLSGLAGGTHEVTVTMHLDQVRKVEEKIVIDATKVTAADLSKRIDQAIVAAEENEAARALLPEIFTEPFVPMEAAGFEPETIERVLAKCIAEGGKLVAVRMHSPGAGFTVERNALKQPIARTSSSYASLLYELDGKYFVMPEAVMFCQNYNAATGEFGPAMRPLFLQMGYQYRIREKQLARLHKG